MDKEKLEKLKELAERATPGPWADGDNVERILGRRHDMNHGTVYMNYQDCGTCPRVLVFCNPLHGIHQTKQDAAFIAAANPQTVLELIEELERVDQEANYLAITLENCLEALKSAQAWRKEAGEFVERGNGG